MVQFTAAAAPSSVQQVAWRIGRVYFKIYKIN
jgi:hypothetical protein